MMLIINSQDNKISRIISRKYGKLAEKTWRSLIVKKIINKTNFFCYRTNFYTRLHKLFTKFLYSLEKRKITSKKLDIFDNLKSFIRCLPSIEFLKRFINKADFSTSAHLNDLLFIIFSLAIYEIYLEKFDYPCYAKLKIIINDCCLPLYLGISDENLKKCRENLKIRYNSYSKSKIILTFKILD